MTLALGLAVVHVSHADAFIHGLQTQSHSYAATRVLVRNHAPPRVSMSIMRKFVAPPPSLEVSAKATQLRECLLNDVTLDTVQIDACKYLDQTHALVPGVI